jgi:hypothetical protein
VKDVARFANGLIVYHKVNPGIPGLVTGVVFRTTHVEYFVIWEGDHCEEIHQEMELTSEKNAVVESNS